MHARIFIIVFMRLCFVSVYLLGNVITGKSKNSNNNNSLARDGGGRGWIHSVEINKRPNRHKNGPYMILENAIYQSQKQSIAHSFIHLAARSLAHFLPFVCLIHRSLSLFISIISNSIDPKNNNDYWKQSKSQKQKTNRFGSKSNGSSLPHCFMHSHFYDFGHFLVALSLCHWMRKRQFPSKMEHVHIEASIIHWKCFKHQFTETPLINEKTVTAYYRFFYCIDDDFFLFAHLFRHSQMLHISPIFAHSLSSHNEKWRTKKAVSITEINPIKWILPQHRTHTQTNTTTYIFIWISTTFQIRLVESHLLILHVSTLCFLSSIG